MYRITVLTISLVLFLSGHTLAAESTRVKVSNLDHFARILDSARNSSSFARKPTRFKAYINGLGRISFEFASAKKSRVRPQILVNGRTVNDVSPVILMKGWATLAGTSTRSAATLNYSGENPELTVSFLHLSNTTGQSTIYRLTFSKISNQIQTTLQRTKPVHLRGKTCGNDHDWLPAANLNRAPVRHSSTERLFISSSSQREVDISLHADSSYIGAYGTNTAYLQARINEVETIYQDDLGLSFNVVRLIADNSFSVSSSEGGTLLVDFANYIASKGYDGNADVFHLFTAEDITSSGNSSTIGVAFYGFSDDPDPGVVCRPNRFLSDFGFKPAAVGATERSSGFTSGSVMITVAHEIAHNFAADHSASGIMEAALDFDNIPTAFSSFSQNQITSYINTHGSCLASINNPDPTPTPDPDSDPDSDGGNSGGGGSDSNNPESIDIGFSHSLSSSGLFTATISLDEPPEDDCYFRLRMNSKRNVGYGTLVASTLATSMEHTFTAQIDRKARRRNRRGKRLKIFAQANLECMTTNSGSSEVQRVKAHRIKKRRKKSARGWIKLLKREFSE